MVIELFNGSFRDEYLNVNGFLIFGGMNTMGSDPHSSINFQTPDQVFEIHVNNTSFSTLELS